MLNTNEFCSLAVPPQIKTVQPDPVFFNTPVQLVCVVIGGDPPRNITWTSSNGTQVYFTNSTAGTNISLSITRYDYGEYVCTASNEFGETDGSIQVRHPGQHAFTLNMITS